MLESKLRRQFDKLMKVGMALTAEKDYDKLLELILTETRTLAEADGGTLYIVQEGKLHHKIMQTVSMDIFLGGGGEPIDFEPIEISEENVSGYAVIHRKPVNIPDVYHTQLFDFSGPKDFDKSTGYVTRSMLVFPLINRSDEVIGVVQLINALEEGERVPFDESLEEIVMTLSSQAGIAIENMQYVENIKAMFDSFVKVLVTAVEERTPYNANHSRNVAKYVEAFARAINLNEEGPYGKTYFDEAHISNLVTSAWLHDIGKVTVPEKVMDKPTRLGEEWEPLNDRLDKIKASINACYYRQKCECSETINEVKWQEDLKVVDEARQFFEIINEGNIFMDDKKRETLDYYYHYRFCNIEDQLLNDKCYKLLSIVKGTLTREERQIMENHVVTTERMLNKMTFPKDMMAVPEWAINHHEYLDGSGYTKQLKAHQLSTESRMLTIVDIYDALTATDRPYKKGMPDLKAYQILGFMVQEGKLDGDLLDIFKKR